MNSHDRQTHYAPPTQEELETYMRRGRELRSQAIARGTKRVLGRLNRNLRSLLRHSAGNGHRSCTAS